MRKVTAKKGFKFFEELHNLFEELQAAW